MSEKPSKPMIDRCAEQLAHTAARWNGRSMAMVERIITGPTTDPDVGWLVVLYRSTQVERSTQLVGYAMYISETSYARLTVDELEYFVRDIWAGAIDEPPGSDLPKERLNPAGIAWWVRAEGWSTQSGPPDGGLPATRTYVLDPPPHVLRELTFRGFEEEFWLGFPAHLRAVELAADIFGVEANFILEKPADEMTTAWMADLETRTLRKLPDGLTATFRLIVSPRNGNARWPDSANDSPTVERRTLVIGTNR